MRQILKAICWVLPALPATALIVFSVCKLWPINNQLSEISPVITANIAALAATIAFYAVLIQRDVARRRAALDFFLKTEMDNSAVAAWNAFEALIPSMQKLAAKPDLKKSDDEYKAIRNWLNICELIAVGVRRGALSEIVTLDYWGYVLPNSFNNAESLIRRFRANPEFGSSETYSDLERLCKTWAKRTR